MARITGIGGFFFRARDPKALAEWYETHLGIADGSSTFWVQDAGPTAFAAFSADTEYFPSEHKAMLNLRVDDLNGFLTKLASDGIVIERRAEWDSTEIGKFARIHDPEGNPIELWEPQNPDQS